MEKEKYYNIVNDRKMQIKHLYTQRLCHKFSALDPIKIEKRKKLIKTIVNSIGENFTIEQPFHCDYGYFITIGKKLLCQL